MAEDKNRQASAGGEAVGISLRDGEYVPYGLAVEHVLRATSGSSEDGARDRLLLKCRNSAIRVRFGKSSNKQAEYSLLRSSEKALAQSLWSKDDLEREFPIIGHSISQLEEANRKNKGGHPMEYPWEKLAVCFGSMLGDERSMPKKEDKIKAIQEIASALGIEPPSRSTIQPHLKDWLEAHAEWQERDDPDR
jgi:hypothetical protein